LSAYPAQADPDFGATALTGQPLHGLATDLLLVSVHTPTRIARLLSVFRRNGGDMRWRTARHW